MKTKLRKIVPELSVIPISAVNHHATIFVAWKEKLCGMVINDGGYWSVRCGGTNSTSPGYDTLSECIKAGQNLGYEFFQE